MIDSLKDRNRALHVINAGEAAIYDLMKRNKEDLKELEKTKLDFVNIRNLLYGPGNGKTGRINKRKKQDG